MALEEGLVALLLADSGISTLVDTRIYPVLVPENATYPCLSYQIVSYSDDLSTDNKAIREKRVQFDAYATTYKECKQIEAALGSALETYQGTLSDGTRVLNINTNVVIDNWEQDSREYRVTCEYSIQYT